MAVRLTHRQKSDLQQYPVLPALQGGYLLTGIAATVKPNRRLVVPDKIPYLLTGQSATISKLPPVWGSLSSYTLTEGVAVGATSLPVTVPGGGSPNIVVSWHSSSVPSTKPTWVTLTAGTTPTIAFTGGQLDANDVTSMVLTATANGQSVNSSAVTITVTSGEPSWTTVPSITLHPSSLTHDFSQYVTNWNGSNHQMIRNSGSASLPANLSLATTGIVTFNGNTNYATTSGLIFEVVDNAAADWASRTANALLAENFDYADLTAARSTASGSPYWGDSGTGQVSLTDTHALSGRALRQAWTSSTTSNPNTWILMLSGRRDTTAEIPKVYVQFIVWADELWNVTYNDGGSGTSTAKIAIIDRHDGSSNTGELVLVNSYSQGFVSAYRHTGNETGALLERSRTLSGYTGVTQQISNVDAGGAAPATVAQFHRRFGPANLSQISTRPTLGGGSVSSQGFPNADCLLSGAITWNRGGWTVVECELDKTYTANGANGRMRVWAAHYGNAPVLLMDTTQDDTVSPVGSALVGSRAGWTGIQITPYVTNHAAQAGLDPNVHYMDVCEVISSLQPIPFPLQPGVPLP